MCSVSDENLLAFAGECLQAVFYSRTARQGVLEKELMAASPMERVNITLRTRGRLRGSMSARGESLGQQLCSAVRQAATDSRFGARITAVELPWTVLEIWLQTKTRQVSQDDISSQKILVWGVEGVEIRADGRSAYYKPSVPITSRKSSVEGLMSALCQKAGLGNNRWREPGALLLCTSWKAVVRSNNHVIAHHASQQSPSGADIHAWLLETVGYLVNSRQASGDFTYLYDPIHDREVLERPSRVRSAGCLYALATYLDRVSEPIDSDLALLVRDLAHVQIGLTRYIGEVGRVLPENDLGSEAKMGATALLALALGSRSLRPHFSDIYEELILSISNAQMPNSRFQTHLGDNEEVVRSSEFFSGQALLTLVQRAERGNTESQTRVTEAFGTYQKQFSETPTSAFAGWHVDVWTRMATLTGMMEFAEFAFSMTDWLLTIQIQQSEQILWVGGFSASNRMPKFSSIVFLEAVVRAYRLARKIGNAARCELYGNAIRKGVRFCGMLRLNSHHITWCPNPERSRGGIALTPTDLRIRCDVPQHFITLALCLLDTPELLND